MVEHSAVNRSVVSSSLSGAAMIADEKAAKKIRPAQPRGAYP